MTNPESKPNSEPLPKDDQILIGPVRTRTSAHALVHGLYASDIVLSWESKDDFEQLWRELKVEWMPQGRQEYETLVSLARLNWLKHRLMRSTQIAFRKDPFLAELEKAGAKTWADISNLMDQKAAAEDGLMTEVKETVKELKLATQNARKLMDVENPDTIEAYKSIETVSELFFKNNGPVYQKAFDKVYQKRPNAPDMNDPGVQFSDVYTRNPATLVEQAYHPDYLEKLVRLEASIDTRIDKILNRLTSLKEYKRIAEEMRSSKSVSSPAIAPPPNGEN